MTEINALSRAELAALVAQALLDAGIDVVLVGGSCVCLYTNERFGSLDLDFIDLTYARKSKIASALNSIGFVAKASSRYFEREGCRWSLEFPSAPLAIGKEQITTERTREFKTALGPVRLLSPTDCVKDRLLWWSLEADAQCRELTLEVAKRNTIDWKDLQTWHNKEGYADRYSAFQRDAGALENLFFLVIASGLSSDCNVYHQYLSGYIDTARGNPKKQNSYLYSSHYLASSIVQVELKSFTKGEAFNCRFYHRATSL